MKSRRSRALDDLESRIVWILGGPRSGSTWLLELLVYPLTPSGDAASGAALRSPDADARPQAIPLDEPLLGTHLAPVVAIHPIGVFTPAEMKPGDSSYFFAERYADTWRPALRRLILERIAAQADVASRDYGLDRPLVAVKEPNGSNAAPMLTSTLPRSRLLFLLRDGRDVLDSLLDAVSPGSWLAGGTDTDLVSSAEGRVQYLRREASLWLHRILMIERALETHPPELAMTVRYEDLRRDTAASFGAVTDWLGVEQVDSAIAATAFESLPEEERGRGKHRRLATPGHWRESLSAEEQDAIHEIMGTKLAQLGYEV